jgi:hypothetical protein
MACHPLGGFNLRVMANVGKFSQVILAATQLLILRGARCTSGDARCSNHIGTCYSRFDCEGMAALKSTLYSTRC